MREKTLNLRQKTTSRWRDYLELCKPKVVVLMLVTAMVGMCLAIKGPVPWHVLLWGNIGIAFVAGAAAVVNHVADQHQDIIMRRTQQRPIVQGKISPRASLLFSFILCITGMSILILFINVLTAVLSFSALVGYAGIYTFYLKHATPQNIVIGGLAGAAPPLLGWCAVTNQINAGALLLVLIIFVWTPPHFWALAIYRVDDYKKAKTPMLPITHGIAYTKRHILLYTWLLFAACLLPFIINMSSWFYLCAAVLLNGRFLYYAITLRRTDDPLVARAMFRYSIVFLLYLFCALLIDHYMPFILAIFPS